MPLAAIPILSEKCPNLEELDVSDCYLSSTEFARLLCARDSKNGQLFPRLHSLTNASGSAKGRDLSLLMKEREGLENFRVLNISLPFGLHDETIELFHAERLELWER